MSDIKTKETHKDIKILDKTASGLRNVKKASVRTKDGVENLLDDGQISPSEYAENQLKYALLRIPLKSSMTRLLIR